MPNFPFLSQLACHLMVKFNFSVLLKWNPTGISVRVIQVPFENLCSVTTLWLNFYKCRTLLAWNEIPRVGYAYDFQLWMLFSSFSYWLKDMGNKSKRKSVLATDLDFGFTLLQYNPGCQALKKSCEICRFISCKYLEFNLLTTYKTGNTRGGVSRHI